MKQGQHVQHMGNTGTIAAIRDGWVRVCWKRPDPSRRSRMRVWYPPDIAAQLLRGTS